MHFPVDITTRMSLRALDINRNATLAGPQKESVRYRSFFAYAPCARVF
jgi:hypothetical protein